MYDSNRHSLPNRTQVDFYISSINANIIYDTYNEKLKKTENKKAKA